MSRNSTENVVSPGKIVQVKPPATAVTVPGFGRIWMRDSTMRDVTWRAIPGAEFYEASSDGQIRSIDREIIRGNGAIWRLKGRRIRQFANPRDNYMQVRITFDDGSRRSTRAHRLICLAFHGMPPSDFHEVRHLNGLRQDNRVENLCWGTKSENQFDRVAHGNHRYANQTHCKHGHRLTKSNIYEAPSRPGSRSCRTCRRMRSRRRVAT